MKAIQIRYLSCTDTKPARLKAWTEGGVMIEELNYEIEIDEQALELAGEYVKKMGWKSEVVGFGSLPNGDWVAVLG